MKAPFRRGLALLVLAAASSAAAGTPRAESTLEIRLVSSEGRAVEGARVSLWRSRADEGALARGSSDEEGLARLPLDSECGECLLSVAHPRHPRVVRRLDLQSGPSISIELARGNSRSIRVLDAKSGTLVPGFRAVVFPAAGIAGERAFLADALFARPFDQSEEASARIEGLGEDPAALLVHSPRHALQILPLAPTGRGPLVARLDDDSCREISLVSESTGLPVPDARVAGSAHMLDGSLATLALWSKSDAAGRVLHCPPPGTNEIHVRHPAHAPLRLRMSDVEAGSRVKLREAARISGHVLDADGNPVPGARLTLRSSHGELQAESGPAGAFELAGLPREEVELEVRLAAGQGEARMTRLVDLEGQSRRILALQLRQAPRLEVVDAAGEAVQEATLVTIVADRAVAEARLGPEGVTSLPRCDESGALVSLREGSSLYFDAPSPPTRALDRRRLRVPAEVVSGRVVDAEGRALEGALVTCAPRQASLRRDSGPGPLWLPSRRESIVARGSASLAATDSRGEFSLRRPAWCEALEAQGPPAKHGKVAEARARVDLSGGLDELEIQLSPGFGARARVDALAGREALTGRIELRRPESSTPRGEFALVAGHARIDLEDAGPWMLVARVESYAPALSAPFLARAGEEREILLRVERGAFLVIDVEGAWPSDESTPVIDEAGRDWAAVTEAFPAGDARLMLGPLPLGEYRINYSAGAARARLKHAGQVVEVPRPRH